MEREAAKNKKDLPAYINFTCVPYAGLSEITFKIRVSMLTGADRIGFTLRVVGEEEHDEQIADEFKKKISSIYGRSRGCKIYCNTRIK